MTFLKPLPRSITRPVSLLLVVGWVVSMAVLIDRTYARTAAATLATDLARYGSSAQWRGIYYRGEKIGFSVSQTVPTADGFELQEDGRLQMLLLGASSAAAMHTVARVDPNFALRSFEFSLDPGNGAVVIRGRVEPVANGGGRAHLTLGITTSGKTRTETRELTEVPVLSQNFSRLLAGGHLSAGTKQQW